MGSDRVTVIADAATDVIAERGMRGLTHRAVDARAGLPLGSSSAHFRTRSALIEGVVRRLAVLDQADVEAGGLAADPASPAGPAPLSPAALDHLASQIAGLLDRWLTVGRNRALARYACLLEATHRPELRVLAYGSQVRAQARALLAAAGVPDPERAGDRFVACIDGLFFDRLVGAGGLTAPPPGTAEHRDDLGRAIRSLLPGQRE